MFGAFVSAIRPCRMAGPCAAAITAITSSSRMAHWSRPAQHPPMPSRIPTVASKRNSSKQNRRNNCARTARSARSTRSGHSSITCVSGSRESTMTASVRMRRRCMSMSTSTRMRGCSSRPQCWRQSCPRSRAARCERQDKGTEGQRESGRERDNYTEQTDTSEKAKQKQQLQFAMPYYNCKKEKIKSNSKNKNNTQRKGCLCQRQANERASETTIIIKMQLYPSHSGAPAFPRLMTTTDTHKIHYHLQVKTSPKKLDTNLQDRLLLLLCPHKYSSSYITFFLQNKKRSRKNNQKPACPPAFN